MAKAYKLHLELDIDGADLEVLKKYGRVKEGITRDILAPANMTLHALNYAIQRLFGWGNSHLHHFELSDEKFKSIAGDKFLNWAKYAGVYFRFPTEIEEDVYWDDAFCDSSNIKAWLKSKYTGDYEYHGMFEHFMEAQCATKEFISENKQLQILLPFHEWREASEEEQKNPKKKKIEDVTCDEVDRRFLEIGSIKELLERLTLEEVLGDGQPTEIPSEKYEENLTAFLRAHKKYLNNLDEPGYWKKVNPMNPKVSPITNEIFYRYDYGDGWRVKITLDKIDDEPISKPSCIAADGLPVMDDVGGVHGYCDFLTHVKCCGSPRLNDDIAPEEMREWAKDRGWTGRMCKPENML